MGRQRLARVLNDFGDTLPQGLNASALWLGCSNRALGRNCAKLEA